MLPDWARPHVCSHGRVFGKPPSSFALITHPAWYLDPSLRPKNVYELAKPVQDFVNSFAKDAWRGRTCRLERPQFEAAFALLPKVDVARLLGDLRNNRVGVVVDRKNPRARMVVCSLFEFSSPASAQDYVAAGERLIHIKKAKMTTGAVRFRDAKFTPIVREHWSGVLVEELLQVGIFRVHVTAVLGARGAVGCELLYSGEKITTTAAIAKAEALLRSAVRH